MNSKQNNSKKIRIKTLIILFIIAFFGVFRIITVATSASKNIPKNNTVASHYKSEIKGEVTSITSRTVGVFITVLDNKGETHPIFGEYKSMEKIKVGDLVDVIIEDGKIKHVTKISKTDARDLGKAIDS